VQNLFRRILFQYWYFGQPRWDTGISPPELLDFIETHKPARAIDIGCGTGTNVITLAKSGWQVTGVDFAPRAIRLAKRKIKSSSTKADLQVRDATELRGINGPFEFALDIGCFHSIHKAGKAKYLKELHRILAPDGFWLMYGFLKSETLQAGTGLDQTDLQLVSSTLTLVSRRDGTDDKRDRTSAWFLYQKQSI
jgi:ubiquinone/menaquinone biosynthesis C-methylase UbiE